MDLAEIDRLTLQREVENLIALHAELIDEDRLEEWPELFVENCTYSVMPRENADRDLPIAAIFCDSRAMLVDRIVSLRRANIYPVHHYRHIISSTRVHSVSSEVIKAQTNYLVLLTRNNGRSDIYNSGKYVDEIVHDGECFRFRSKKAIFDTNLIDTMMARPI